MTKRSTILGAVAIFAIWAGRPVAAIAQDADATTTTVTAATGTITQLNYGDDGEVQGFLIGTKILLMFQGSACGGVSTLGAVGNSVTYSGTEYTATSGFESVAVSSFTNTTNKAAYTAPTTTSTAYGPTSGTLKQLNYDGSGSTNGFLFTPSGSTAPIFVSINSRASSTLTPLLTVGATVSVTGTTSASMSACSSTSTPETVDASSLTIGTQTIVIAGGGGPNNGNGGNAGHH